MSTGSPRTSTKPSMSSTTTTTRTRTRRTLMLDRRIIPDPTLARAEIDARLRALGYTRAGVEPRTHSRYRLQSWRHPTGASVLLCEAHVVGERYVAVSSEANDELARTLDGVSRATMLREADAASGPFEAL